MPDRKGWGWTANIPGFGLLADQFPDPKLNIWKFGLQLASFSQRKT